MASHQRQLRQERRAARRAAQNDNPTSRGGKPILKPKRTKEGFGEYPTLVKTGSIKKFDPLTTKQSLLYHAIHANCLIFASGPAGTGKTHVPIHDAFEQLLAGKIKMIVMTKSDFELGEKLGAVPGDKDEKIAGRVRSMRDIAIKLVGASHLEYLEKAGKVVFEALGQITGLTYDDAYIIIDEAQCATKEQMKALITRIGHRSKVIVCGDYLEQKYIRGVSGMYDAIKRFENEEEVAHIEFDLDDVVRSDFCKTAIAAYRKEITL